MSDLSFFVARKERGEVEVDASEILTDFVFDSMLDRFASSACQAQHLGKVDTGLIIYLAILWFS